MDLCQDGVNLVLLNENGIWFVLQHEGEELTRFPSDLSEVRATLNGRITLQYTDGLGNGIEIEGDSRGLKVRLQDAGRAPKNCRISRDDVEKIHGTIMPGV